MQPAQPSSSGSQRLRRAALVLVLLLALWVNHGWREATAGHGHNGAAASDSLPPALAVTTVALGPLRGLLANALWWRVIEQQDAGNYFEMMQLAQWITVLQPRHAKVWTFQAWNMAYNVAYEFPDGESKWPWIRRAMDLLVHEGLRVNPGNDVIRAELSRLFIDRVGSTIDVGAKVFRRKWARAIVPYVPNGDRRDLEELASVPDTPEAMAARSDMIPVLAKARELGLDLMDAARFYNHAGWSDEQRAKVKDEPEFRKPLAALHAYFRAQSLRRELGLEPKRMLAMDREYGPLDWRLYHAYVVYWEGPERFDEYVRDRVNANPRVRQALQRSFLDGALLFDPANGVFITTNNFAIMGKLHDYYDFLMEHHFSPEVDNMHRRFLEQAGAILYTFNRMAGAREVFEHYKEDYAEEGLDFETWVAKSVYEVLHKTTFKDRQSLVESALFQAFNWLASGDTQRAVGYAKFAKLAWSKHQKKYANNPARRLPPLDELRRAAFAKIMEGDVAPGFKDRLYKATMAPIDDHDAGSSTLYLGETIEKGTSHKARQADQGTTPRPEREGGERDE